MGLIAFTLSFWSGLWVPGSLNPTTEAWVTLEFAVEGADTKRLSIARIFCGDTNLKRSSTVAEILLLRGHSMNGQDEKEIEPWVLIRPIPTPDGFAFDMAHWSFASRREAEDFRATLPDELRSAYTSSLLRDSPFAPSHYFPMKKRLNDVHEVKKEASQFDGMNMQEITKILAERYPEAYKTVQKHYG